MIGRLEGEIALVRPGYVIVMVGGIGYRVAAPSQWLARHGAGSTAALWIHTHVREDAFDLYGFDSEEELHLFELLLTVSGIGPRSALAIIDLASIETLRSAIATGRAEYLTKVSGVGKKTAEKIVLELRDKIGAAAIESTVLKGDEDALEAMKSLGYSAAEARTALREVPSTVESTNDRLREALKILGGH